MFASLQAIPAKNWPPGFTASPRPRAGCCGCIAVRPRSASRAWLARPGPAAGSTWADGSDAAPHVFLQLRPSLAHLGDAFAFLERLDVVVLEPRRAVHETLVLVVDEVLFFRAHRLDRWRHAERLPDRGHGTDLVCRHQHITIASVSLLMAIGGILLKGGTITQAGAPMQCWGTVKEGV